MKLVDSFLVLGVLPLLLHQPDPALQPPQDPGLIDLNGSLTKTILSKFHIFDAGCLKKTKFYEIELLEILLPVGKKYL